MFNLEDSLLQVTSTWRFIGTLAARVDVDYDNDITPTACTDGNTFIKINSDFVANKTKEDVIILIAHEVLHIVLNHTYRKPDDVNHRAWNIAEDIVINSMLEEHYVQGRCAGLFQPSRMTIHNSGLWPSGNKIDVNILTKDGSNVIHIDDIYNKTVMEIYDTIMDKALILADDGSGKGDGQGDGLGSGDSGFDDHSKITDPDTPENARTSHSDTKWHQAITTAATAEKKAKGELPGSLRSLVAELVEPKISWKDILKNKIMSSMITDSRYGIYNKRSCVLGTPMPGYVREGLNCVVHIDTSGSTAGDLPALLSELKSIVSMIPGASVPVIQCDYTIQSVDDLSSTDFSENSVSICGFGGTSHRPVVGYINEMPNTPEVFVSFTDGYSDIEHCYGDLKFGISRIICLPKSSKDMVESLSPYGDVLVIE